MNKPASPPSPPSDILLVPLLNRLAHHRGLYTGDGVNHAGDRFHAKLEIKAELDTQLIAIRFRASDADNAFHEERTWITENLLKGGIGLWTVSTNTPGILEMELVEDTNDGSYSTRAVFRLGNPDDLSRFRQEISLSIRHDGGLEYVYSWGVPHEKFGVKTKALLRPAVDTEQDW
ncbi:MAG: hypothetical protein RBT63_02220 [Bdellovibrionales bacterium]|jgi:hypothetical protein|nr:hypothetical protein [Bdellovibrionales bacterium]